MDPLDPLTEIIRSGEAFSPFIFTERLLWLLIGIFFLGAMTTGVKNNMKDQRLDNNKSSFLGFTKKNKSKDNSIPNDGEENISKS